MKPLFDKFVDKTDVYSALDSAAEERSNKIDIVLDKMNNTESLLIKKITLSDWSLRKAAKHLNRSKSAVERLLKKAHGNFKVIYQEIFKDN